MLPEHPRDEEWSNADGERPAEATSQPPLVGSGPPPVLSVPSVYLVGRPVSADLPELVTWIPYARPLIPVIRWWRALLEAFAPIVATIVATTLAVPLLYHWHLDEDRWGIIVLTEIGGVAAILACLGLLRLSRQPLSTIGLTTRNLGANIGIGLAAWVATATLLIATGIIVSHLYPQIAEQQEKVAQAMQETFPRMSLATTAVFMAFVAIWEEIAFRGFMLTRLQVIFKRWWLTIPIGAVLFGCCHLYEGPLGVAQVTLLGVVMGVLFRWRKSLVPGIVFHALNNVVAILMLNLWMAAQNSS